MSEQEERIKISFETNADQTRQSVDGVANSVNKTTDAVEQQTQAQVSLRQQLRNANIELQNTINKYGETSKEAIASAKAVANLKDQMEFAQQLSESFNPDQKFKALTSATQLAGTGLQGVTSGMALFGDQSKETQEQLLKVQAAMAFSDAISNLSNVADQWAVLKTTISQSSVATKLHTATMGTATIVQKAFGVAVDTTSFSFKALKFAIAGTGIGLLVTGVATLVNNFDDLKAIVFKAVPQLEAIGKTIKGIVQSVTDFLGFTSEVQRTHDDMTKKANKSIKDNEYLLDVNANKYDEYTKRKIQANIDYNKKANELREQLDEGEIKSNEFNAKLRAYREKANREIVQADLDRASNKTKKIEKESKSEIKAIDDNRKNILEKQKELQRQLEDLDDDTEQKKLDRRKKRAEQEIIDLGVQGKKKAKMLLAIDKIFAKEQSDLNKKIEDEKKQTYDQNHKEFLEKFKTQQEEIADYSKADFDAQIEAIYENEQARIDAEKEIALQKSEQMGGTPEEILQRENAINNFYRKEDIKAEEEYTNAKIDLKKREKDAINGIGNQAVGLAKDIFAKNKNIQKGILIAESGVAIGKVAKNTIEGVSASISTSPLTIGMPWSGIIAAKGILDTATIISSTNKALQSLGGGSVSGGGASSQPSAPIGVSAQPQIGVQASQENQIATSIATVQTDQPPIKAYVVSSDVTKAQNLDSKIIQENSF